MSFGRKFCRSLHQRTFFSLEFHIPESIPLHNICWLELPGHLLAITKKFYEFSRMLPIIQLNKSNNRSIWFVWHSWYGNNFQQATEKDEIISSLMALRATNHQPPKAIIKNVLVIKTKVCFLLSRSPLSIFQNYYHNRWYCIFMWWLSE